MLGNYMTIVGTVSPETIAGPVSPETRERTPLHSAISEMKTMCKLSTLLSDNLASFQRTAHYSSLALGSIKNRVGHLQHRIREEELTGSSCTSITRSRLEILALVVELEKETRGYLVPKAEMKETKERSQS